MVEVAWLVFVVASLMLILTPGQDMLLVMSRSLTQGAAAGVVTAAGVSVGLLGHTFLATLGLGAILRTSEWLFFAFKLVGAAYLLYLGVSLILTRQKKLTLGPAVQRPLAAVFLDGALSNLTNPKVALFYFAFLPQFVSPSATHPTLALFALRVLFAALTFVVKGPIGIFAGVVSGWLRSRPHALTWIYRSSGAILVGLGVQLAFDRR